MTFVPPCADSTTAMLTSSINDLHCALSSELQSRIAGVRSAQTSIDEQCSSLHVAVTANTQTMESSSTSFEQLRAAQQDVLQDDSVLTARASIGAASSALDAVQQHLAHGRLAQH